MTKVKPWMQGLLIVNYWVGVRVYDLGYCTARCGFSQPAPCPNSSACRRYEYYVVRWNQDGSMEWRKAGEALCLMDVLKRASERAERDTDHAHMDKTLFGFIKAAHLDGRL